MPKCIINKVIIAVTTGLVILSHNVISAKSSSFKYKYLFGYSNSNLISFSDHPIQLEKYGSIIVDINNILDFKNSKIIPTINSEGKPLLLALHCNKKKINIFIKDKWIGWEDIQLSFEERLFSDICN